MVTKKKNQSRSYLNHLVFGPREFVRLLPTLFESREDIFFPTGKKIIRSSSYAAFIQHVVGCRALLGHRAF